MNWLVALALALVGLVGCDVVYSLDRPEGGWAEVAPGHQHGCGRTFEGELYCWGGNVFGQIGTGDELAMIDAPVQVTGTWREHSTEFLSTCGIQDDGTLWCWGSNINGELGIGSTTATRIPKQLPGTWTSVDAGFFHACAIDDADALWCWGLGTYGELGNGAMTSSLAPVQVDDAAWIAVAAGGTHTCGIRDDGSLWCWGEGRATPTSIGSEQWESLVALGEATCGITRSHQLRCWGKNTFHQLGIEGGDQLEPTPVLIDGKDEDDWVQVGAAPMAACGIRSDRSAWCWGSSDRGQLANDATIVETPQRIAHPKNGSWARVDASASNVCLVDTAGRAWCAGSNGSSQLADGGASPRVPTKLAEDWPSVDAGDHVTCAIRDGALACAGSGAQLQLARGDLLARQELVPIEGTWSAVTGGNDHQCGIDPSGVASCWGLDFFSTLGDGGSAVDSAVPVRVATTKRFVAIDAGGSHTCGIETAGAMHCWGYNASGQIGNNSSTQLIVVPQAIVGAADWSALSAGGDHTCGISVTGDGRCWGANANGQVGDATLADRRSPVLLVPDGTMPKLAVISAGYDHTCAVGIDASLWCWGANPRGQLGYDTGFSLNEARPRALAGATWRTVSAGNAHTCAIRTDDTLWCWGANDSGQLGDGTLLSRRMPVQVAGEGWATVTCGTDHTCGTRGDGSTWCWGSNSDGATATGGAWTSELREIVAPAR